MHSILLLDQPTFVFLSVSIVQNCTEKTRLVTIAEWILHSTSAWCLHCPVCSVCSYVESCPSYSEKLSPWSKRCHLWGNCFLRMKCHLVFVNCVSSFSLLCFLIWTCNCGNCSNKSSFIGTYLCSGESVSPIQVTNSLVKGKKNISTIHLCPWLSSLCQKILSWCHNEHLESETGAPVWQTAHTDHPLQVLNCAPSSQNWGCWSGTERHTLCLSYCPLWVLWQVGFSQFPQCPLPSHPSQRSWCLWDGCMSPAEPQPPCTFQLACLLSFSSLDPDPPHWRKNENMSGTLQATDARRLCQIHPGGHQCQPDGFLVDDAFQQSLGFCWKERKDWE